MKKITYIQLRAARQILNIGVRELATLLKVSKSTISKAELNKTRDFFFKYNAALQDFFQKNNITFPTEFSIRFHPINNPQENMNSDNIILTKFQLKTARCILNVSQLELSYITGINKGHISRAEILDNTETIKPSDKEIIIKLRNFFIQQNIEFPDPFYVFYKNYIDNRIIA